MSDPQGDKARLPAKLWQHVCQHLSDKEKVGNRLISKQFDQLLCPLLKDLTLHKQISQRALEYIARTYTEIESLYISPEYDDDTPALDWQRVCFPKLRSLSLHRSPVKSIFFQTSNTPALEGLDINHQGPREAEAFEIALPELKSLGFDHVLVSYHEPKQNICRSCSLRLLKFTSSFKHADFATLACHYN